MNRSDATVGQIVINIRRQNVICQIDSMSTTSDGREFALLTDNFGFVGAAWFGDITPTDEPLPISNSATIGAGLTEAGKAAIA